MVLNLQSRPLSTIAVGNRIEWGRRQRHLFVRQTQIVPEEMLAPARVSLSDFNADEKFTVSWFFIVSQFSDPISCPRTCQ